MPVRLLHLVLAPGGGRGRAATLRVEARNARTYGLQEKQRNMAARSDHGHGRRGRSPAS